MRFIELHRSPDGQPRLVNLDDIAEIRPANNGQHAIVEYRSGNADAMPMPTKESYKDIRGSLIRAGVITV